MISELALQDIGVFAYSIIKFRNKSEYSVTHMFNPTLVKLSRHITYYNSYYIDWNHTLSSFIGSISLNSFLSSHCLKENIVPHTMTFLHNLSLGFSSSESQVPSLFSFCLQGWKHEIFAFKYSTIMSMKITLHWSG
jgi:hypothetical protein